MLNGLTHHSDQAVNTTEKKKKSRNTQVKKKKNDFRAFGIRTQALGFSYLMLFQHLSKLLFQAILCIGQESFYCK